MFTVLAVLAFVIVLVLGIALVEAFDPMPKAAQAWGKAVAVATVATPLSGMALAIAQARWARTMAYAEQDAAEMKASENAQERALELLWSDGDDYESDYESPEDKYAAQQIAWDRAYKARELAKLGNEQEQAMWVKYITGQYNHACSVASCEPSMAEQLADAYEAEQAGKTRRNKNQKTKWAQRPDSSQPYTYKDAGEYVRYINGYDQQAGRWVTCGKVVEHKPVVVLMERTWVVAPTESHHTKHVNPHKGTQRMSERMGELDSAFGDVWEWEDESAS